MCKHSVTVVASIKYPLQIPHVMCLLSVCNFIRRSIIYSFANAKKLLTKNLCCSNNHDRAIGQLDYQFNKCLKFFFHCTVYSKSAVTIIKNKDADHAIKKHIIYIKLCFCSRQPLAKKCMQTRIN